MPGRNEDWGRNLTPAEAAEYTEAYRRGSGLVSKYMPFRRWSVSGRRQGQGRRPGSAIGGRGRCPAPTGGTGGATPPGVGPAFCRLPAHEARELKKTWRGRVPPPGEVDGRRHTPG
jgi:hypothetical protein